MPPFGSPDWVNPQNSTNTAVSEANVDPGVTASATGGCVLCVVLFFDCER